MTRYVALLRGINVGGKTKVRMADLKAIVESLGHTDVKTYINSGNVVFTAGTPDVDRAGLETAIEQRIEAELGRRFPVLVRSGDELAAILAANPYPEAVPARLLITFLRSELPAGYVDAAATVESGNDEFQVIGTTMYVHCPDGIGRSKLAAALNKPSGVDGTARNLATVRKLLELASAGQSSKGS